MYNQKLNDDLRKIYKDVDYERGTVNLLMMSAMHAAEREDDEGCRNFVEDLTNQLEQLRNRLELIAQAADIIEAGITKGNYSE